MTAVLAHDWFPRPLPDNVFIGDGSWLYSAFAFVHCHSRRGRAVTIGRHSGIYRGSFFELGRDGEVEIGDYTAVVGAIFATNRRIRVGSHGFIAHQVVIADAHHAVPPLAGAAPAAAGALATPAAGVTIGDDVWIGARALLIGDCRIGDGAIVAAGCVVDFDVPAGCVVAGHPARIVGPAADRAGPS